MWGCQVTAVTHKIVLAVWHSGYDLSHLWPGKILKPRIGKEIVVEQPKRSLKDIHLIK